MLDHAVYLSALLHGIICRSRFSVVDVACPQYKFHETTDRDFYFHIQFSKASCLIFMQASETLYDTTNC
jgi:translation initiation factor 2B subunit (eIF-2B alpha/beta/delta family)